MAYISNSESLVSSLSLVYLGPHIQISVSGNVLSGRSYWSVEGLLDLFWSVINFIVLL